MNLTLELDEHPTPEDFRTVLDGVRSFNRAQTGNERPHQVAYFLRDEAAQIVGGVQGSFWGRSVHIDGLWVDERFRGQAYGSKLMKAIEDYAHSQAHPLVYLETASFQALPFYEGLGYEVFGELPEITTGHTLYFLKKELSLECGDLSPL
jgi:GNAT superfamily N-acetyltransferase